MPSIKTIEYDKLAISKIRRWSFGTNWPSVYIIYNDSKAYVGETLDLARRTEQHLQEQQFAEFNNICFISDKTYNKSVILDLESFLIKYISAEGSRELINGNAGVVNHNYFYREAYEEDFRYIWRELISLGIVKKSIQDIENSELFKYSPYKSLTIDQQDAAYEILKRLNDINNISNKSIIEVIGGAGTGKTILAVYLVKLLVDINSNRKRYYSDDSGEIEHIYKLFNKKHSLSRIGFVVPMRELRETIQVIFDSIDGLSKDMILSPEQVVKNKYDLLIVDEAHRLYHRNHLPGSHLYNKFDKINKSIMPVAEYTGTDTDYTELDWIIKSSDLQIIFYDELQTIRASDIDRIRFNEIIESRLYKKIELTSQMRCQGGNGYYEYVRDVLANSKMTIHNYKKIENYYMHVADNIYDLVEIIKEKESENGLSKIITGPGWKIGDQIDIGGKIFGWAGSRRKKEIDGVDDTLYSIHKIQGFDLNYAGVVFGPEVYYDIKSKRIEIDKKAVKDPFTKRQGDEFMREYIINIYRTLMTRGIKGTIIYAMDKNLNDYLKVFFN